MKLAKSNRLSKKVVIATKFSICRGCVIARRFEFTFLATSSATCETSLPEK